MRSRTQIGPFRRFVAVALPALLAAGCVPYLADQQNARILPPGDVELTPSFSYVSFSADGENEHIQDQFGIRAGYGLSRTAELRATAERISLAGESGSDAFTMVGVGVKFGFVPDRLALYIPVGVVLGENLETSETWTVAPTLLVSWRGSPNFELTPSLKAIYPFASEDPELFLGFHLGAGISTNLDRWALRPEVGIVKNPGDEGTTWGLTIGLSIRP
jgi:hypothetical protein